MVSCNSDDFVLTKIGRDDFYIQIGKIVSISVLQPLIDRQREASIKGRDYRLGSQSEEPSRSWPRAHASLSRSKAGTIYCQNISISSLPQKVSEIKLERCLDNFIYGKLCHTFLNRSARAAEYTSVNWPECLFKKKVNCLTKHISIE